MTKDQIINDIENTPIILYPYDVLELKTAIRAKFPIISQNRFEKIKICTGYKLKGEKLKHIPLSIENMNHINPVYETLQGWNSSTQGILNFDKLPKNAKIYIRTIEELIDTRVSLLSTSPDRKDTIMIRDPFKI